MTARPTDELWERMRRLEAERMRPDRPEVVRPPVWRADLRKVIGVLAELLSRPGPADPTTQDHEAEERA
ncbi:hypothetical protein GCM10009525_82750 [Streptosporangium amethystogenes subsp. fukuiense]